MLHPEASPENQGHPHLAAAVGRVLEGISRIHFVDSHGTVEWERGPLELRFRGMPALVLITGAGGEWLRVDDEPWVEWTGEEEEDPGRFRRLDAAERYAEVVGRTLEEVRWLANGWGSVGGAVLDFGGGARLVFVSDGDEEYVFSGGHEAVPAEWGFREVPGTGATTGSGSR